MAMRAKTNTNTGTTLFMRLAVTLLCAGSFSAAYAQRASGQLHISGSVEASYCVEVTGQAYTAIAQGVARGDSLRASVQAGPVSVRVLKANSGSARFDIVVSGAKQELRVPDLPYDASNTILIPDSTGGVPLTLTVIPD